MTSSGKYIIYADDDQDDQELIAEIMLSVGSDVAVKPVRNGIELLDSLASLHKGENYPALIILDINMPIVGGYQALKLLKLNPSYAHIPVVIFSTSDLVEDKKKALRYGAVEYMSKPIYYQDVLTACKRFADLCEGAPVEVV